MLVSVQANPFATADNIGRHWTIGGSWFCGRPFDLTEGWYKNYGVDIFRHTFLLVPFSPAVVRPDPLLSGWSFEAAFLDAWHWCFAVSRGSSWVSYPEQTLSLKSLKACPRSVVSLSMVFRVISVCKRSFAIPCQWAQRKISRITISLWRFGSKPSNTGIAHYQGNVTMLNLHSLCKCWLTCKMSSKSRAASFFISEVFLLNFLIVPHPKVGTSLNLNDMGLTGSVFEKQEF